MSKPSDFSVDMLVRLRQELDAFKKWFRGQYPNMPLNQEFLETVSAALAEYADHKENEHEGQDTRQREGGPRGASGDPEDPNCS